MSSTDTSPYSKAPHNDPPSYNLIAPYAPVTTPPSAPPSSEIDSALLKSFPPGMADLLQNDLIKNEREALQRRARDSS